MHRPFLWEGVGGGGGYYARNVGLYTILILFFHPTRCPSQGHTMLRYTGLIKVIPKFESHFLFLTSLKVVVL